MEKGVMIYTNKPAVVVRREMAKVPAVMEALGPIDRSVFLASTAKTIGEYNAVELTDELGKTLKFIAKDVGYRETDESERRYLVVRVCEILKRYYSNLTLRDFRMAFEMSITGELDDYLPKGRDGQADRGHYQQFNAEYVCKILNAYKLRRAYVLKRAYDAMPQPEREMDPQQAIELRNHIKQDCINAYEYFKEHKHLSPEISPIGEMLYYDLLASVGLAPKIVITIDEQKAIFQRTINEYARRGMVGDMLQLKADGTDAPELQFGAFKMARRKALRKAFERMAADRIVLTDYIKFE